MNKSTTATQQRRGRTYSMSTGIPMLDMANEMTYSGSPMPALTPSAAIPIAGTRGRRRCTRYYSESSSSNSSVKSSPKRNSPVTNALFYAAAKFNESPSPASVPLPPAHWVTHLGSSSISSQDLGA